MLDSNPFHVLEAWLKEAGDAGVDLPEAATLATATPEGRPSARQVLYKGLDDGELLFFTNYRSAKARDLEANPFAALVFHWRALERQIRVEGEARRTSPQVSAEYFKTRPRDSQIGAWASPQSSVIPGREVIVERVLQIALEYEGREVPCPPFWGGYRIRPSAFEFWIGRESRLHDRLHYERDGERWRVTRLAP